MNIAICEGALTLKLINNKFKDQREIQSFSKEELLEVKRKISEFQKEGEDTEPLDSYLESKFIPDMVPLYKDYLNQITEFCKKYLLAGEQDEGIHPYNQLIGHLIEELTLVSNNVVNLKMNARNTKRFVKENAFLADYMDSLTQLTEEYNSLKAQLEKEHTKIEHPFENESYIWRELNKIKNLPFKIKSLPENLRQWEEIKDLYTFISEKYLEKHGKKKRKKATFLTFEFREVYQYFANKQDSPLDYYLNLLYFLYKERIIDDHEEEWFVNALERKELTQKTEKFMNTLLKECLSVYFKEIIEEILQLDEKFTLLEEDKKVKKQNLLGQSINESLSQIIGLYFKGLEKKYQHTLNDIAEVQEYKNIISFYSEKADLIYYKLEDFDEYVLTFEPFLKPFDELITPVKKTINNLFSEILRRKEEYTSYIKTIKNEKLRDTIRNFVNEKINEVNKIIGDYQDEASMIVREEFPQLKRIRHILTEYKDQIQKIKEEVFSKLEGFEDKDVDMYQVIKMWEDNFLRKRQQLSFMLSLLLNKIYKNFKDLIEKEEFLFDSITEITDQEEAMESLPINFAISRFLADKLTEDELNERIKEIQSKINKMNKEITLYQDEIAKLEDILANRVKIREGISVSNIKCTVCHKPINFAKDKIIKCPFCDSVFHYHCVAYGLSKHQ